MEKEKKKPSRLQNQLTAIVVKTITRNANDTKEDFLNKLGADDKELDENKVVASMAFNALVEITKQLLDIETLLTQSTGVMKLLLSEEEMKKLDEGKEV